MKPIDQYWRIGSIAECETRRNNFDDAVEYEGDVYIPLSTFCKRSHIPQETLLGDDMLEVLNSIKARTGVFPIKTIQL